MVVAPGQSARSAGTDLEGDELGGASCTGGGDWGGLVGRWCDSAMRDTCQETFRKADPRVGCSSRKLWDR